MALPLVPVLGLVSAYMLFGWKMLLYLAGMVFCFAVYLVVKQETMLYVPKAMGNGTVRDNPQGMRSPAERALPFLDKTITTSDGEKIHAWYIPAGEFGSAVEKSAPSVIFLHANAFNMGHRMDLFERLHKLVKCNVLVIDYRGYGDSTGTPSEPGLEEDGLAAWRWLQDRAKEGHIDGSKIFLLGRSLGGAVATHMAARLQTQGVKVKGIIIENGFTSIADIVDAHFPWLAWKAFKDQFLRLKWDSHGKVKELKVPILFIAGAKDEIVPHHHMLRLSQAAGDFAELHVVENGMHNDTWLQAGPQYWAWIHGFLVKHAGHWDDK